MKPSGNLSRSKPLQRTTPLVRHTPLVRGKGLQRSPWPRHQPIPQRKPADEQRPARKRPSRAGESRAKRLTKVRSGGLCEIGLPGLCTTWAVDFHHRKLKGQGGRWCPGNGLRSCRKCHRAVTNTDGHRLEYVAWGWLVPAHVKRPAEIPALIPHRLVYPDDQDYPDGTRVRVLLTDDGRYLPAGEEN